MAQTSDELQREVDQLRTNADATMNEMEDRYRQGGGVPGMVLGGIQEVRGKAIAGVRGAARGMGQDAAHKVSEARSAAQQRVGQAGGVKLPLIGIAALAAAGAGALFIIRGRQRKNAAERAREEAERMQRDARKRAQRFGSMAAERLREMRGHGMAQTEELQEAAEKRAGQGKAKWGALINTALVLGALAARQASSRMKP